ncbi:hypothetical protein Tco_0634901 [Tanacetum coccineum]
MGKRPTIMKLIACAKPLFAKDHKIDMVSTLAAPVLMLFIMQRKKDFSFHWKGKAAKGKPIEGQKIKE